MFLGPVSQKALSSRAIVVADEENSDNTKIMGLKSIHLFGVGTFYGDGGGGRHGVLQLGQRQGVCYR